MKAKLIIKRKKNEKGFDESVITHIKLLDDSGKYIKFAKHGIHIVDILQRLEIDIPELDIPEVL